MASIEYKPPPTIKDFIKDYRPEDLFYDWIVGPVGSGKSTGNFFKLAHLASLQDRSPDGIRHSRAVVVRNCFDDKTEILTDSRGWQLFRNLRDDDKVAMLKDGKTVFVAPTLIYTAPYKGKMLGCAKQNLDFLVTPDHNLWTATINGRTKKRAPFKLEHADKAFGLTNREFAMTSGWDGCSDFTPDFFEFLGFWFAEGYAGVYHYLARTHWRLVVSQKIAVEYTREVLTRAGLQWGECDKGDGNLNFVIKISDATKLLCEELQTCGKAKNKAIPNWIKRASPDHLRAFLHGFTMGDGHLKNAPCDTTRLYTSSKQLADDLQEIALLAGQAATINNRTRLTNLSAGREHTEYTVSLLTDSRCSPCPTKKDWYETDYDGVVYCVEVPTHVVYVRRNGKPLWCGQTLPQLKDTTLNTWGYWFRDGQAGKWNATDKNFTLRFNDVECEVLFRPLDTDDDISRVLSLDINYAIVDEFIEIPRKIIEALSGRLGRFKAPGWASPNVWGMWGASNPGTEDNWWFHYLHNELPTNARYFHQPSGLSPDAENIENLPKNYYKNVIIGKSETWVRQYINAEWGFSVSGQPVTPMFRGDLHIAKSPLIYNPLRNLVVALDPGIAGSAMVIGQEDHDGRLNVLHELVQSGYGAERLIAERLRPLLAERYPNARVRIAPDPAAANRTQTDEKTVVDVFRRVFGRENVDIETNNRFPLRLDAMEYYMGRIVDGQPALLVDPANCPIVVRALKGGWRYKVDQKADAIKGSDPEKNKYSHPGDAFGYLCRYFRRQGLRDARYGGADGKPRFVPPRTFGNSYHVT